MVNEWELVYVRGVLVNGDGEGFRIGKEIEFVFEEISKWYDVDDSCGCGVEVMDEDQDVWMVEIQDYGVDIGNGLFKYKGVVDSSRMMEDIRGDNGKSKVEGYIDSMI